MLSKSVSRLTAKPPYLFLITAGILDFMLVILGGSFSYFAYSICEKYLFLPALLFYGYALRNDLSAFSKRRMLLSAVMVSWIMITQIQHDHSDMVLNPLNTVFLVYLLAFPFATATEDRNSSGLKTIGCIFTAASVILSIYGVLLLLDRLPAALSSEVFWDGARLNSVWHPNISACFLMIGIGFSAAICAYSKNNIVRGLMLAAIALQLGAMALTNCRTTILMTGALLGGICFFLIAKKGWKRVILGLMVALVVLAISYKGAGVLYQKNEERITAEYFDALEEGEISESQENAAIPENSPQGTLINDMRTLNSRTYMWYASLLALRANRTVALWGTERAGELISAYNFFNVIHAHNSWFEAVLRMGIPGLMLSLVFTAIAVCRAVKLLFCHDVELWKKIIAMMTMCILVASALEPYLFITNVFIYYHVPDFLFFLCTGYLDYWCHCLPGKTVPAAVADAAVSV